MISSYLDYVRAIIITDKDLSKMENRENIYVDKMLGIVAYNYNFKGHQQCFNDFGEVYGYKYRDETTLAKDGNICFRVTGPVDGKYYVVNYLPKEMSDLKLAAYLEVINKMKDDKISIFAADRLTEDGSMEYQYIDNFNENIYCDIVDSYLEKTK